MDSETRESPVQPYDMVGTCGACRHGLTKTARWLKRNRESANLHHETAPLC